MSNMKNCCCCLPLYVGVCIIGALVFIEACVSALYFKDPMNTGLCFVLMCFFIPLAIHPQSSCTRKTIFVAYLVVTAINAWLLVAGVLLFMVVWPIQKEICR